MFVLGCGNHDRGDDAAGLLAARKLRELGIAAKDCSGEASVLLDFWRREQVVLVIDAVLTGAPVGTVYVWDAGNMDITTQKGSSTHGFGLAEAIALARRLKRLPDRLRVYGIEGRNFQVGSDVSAEVRAAVPEVVEKIFQEIPAARPCPRL